MNFDCWFDFFELSEEAERYASDLRVAGLKARLFLPDSPLQVTPFMVSHKTISQQSETYAALLNALLRLTDVMFDGNIVKFAEAVGFEDLSFANLLAESDDGMLPCRWDLCQKDSQWYAFEVNLGGALGGLPSDDMHATYDRLPLPDGHICDNWHSVGQAIAQSFTQRFGSPDGWQMVVVDDARHFQESPLTANAAASLVARHLGQTVNAIAHTDLDEAVQCATKPLVAFELFTLSDIAAATNGSYDAYLSHCANGKLYRGISLLCDLYMSKACLALLHEAADCQLFDLATCAMIRKAIPKTHLIRADMLPQLTQLTKDQHVLKSAVGYGGSGVFCGWELSQDSWSDMLREASDPSGKYGLCVLQRRIDGEQTPSISIMPDGTWMESDAPQVLGIFQIEGQLCGGVVRQSIAGESVANASRHASVGLIRRVSG